MHKGTRHVGKSPGKPAPSVSTATARRQETALEAPSAKPAVVNPKKRLADLKTAIEKAVAEERYEDAAKLRDEMRALEQPK
jgi:protein arginine kinase activator